MAKVGRPTDYSSEIGAEICTAIASSSKSVRRLCEERPHWPHFDTLFTWRRLNSEFSELFTKAKVAQVEVYIDEMNEIADNVAKDTEMRKNRDGSEYAAPNHEWIARSRLRIDTRKWLASKIAPRLYGDAVRDQLGETLLEKLIDKL